MDGMWPSPVRRAHPAIATHRTGDWDRPRSGVLRDACQWHDDPQSRCDRQAERSLTKCQRRVARRKQGSARRRKAVCWLARAHQHVRRQRQDVQHKTTRALVWQDDVIAHEEVRVRNLVKHPHRAKRIADAGWSAFLSILR